jgi:hypothetical protein
MTFGLSWRPPEFLLVLKATLQQGKRLLTPQFMRDIVAQSLSFLEIGAGEGIRTLDPNLGKVVLYP